MPRVPQRRATRAVELDRNLEDLIERIRQMRNFDFRGYKRATLKRRFERRIVDRRCKNVAEYLALLDREPAELDTLVSSMLIKVTSFFRDPEVWEELGKKVIPRLFSEKKPGEEIRIWAAGCATGEEAFTLAILIAEALGPAFASQNVKIFGTDVDEKAIQVARRGVYGSAQIDGLPRQIIRDYFVQEQGGYSLRKEIRRNVVFGVNNLVTDAPISRLDLLLCRNVFIYLDAAMQRRVLMRFHYALRRHGVLVLGKSELIPFASRLFEPLDVPRRVYRKDGKRELAVAQEQLAGRAEEEDRHETGPSAASDLPLLDRFHREVLDSARLPMIATSSDGTVVLWNKAASRLWGRTEADAAGKKLTALNLPGLSGDLLIEKSRLVREGRAEFQRSLGSIQRPGEPLVQLAVEVSRLADGSGAAPSLVYVAHDITGHLDLEAQLRKSDDERQTAVDELQHSNEQLQSSNEELQTTNEELQSANEELQTTNEELQSTNEELETTNEELQSTNAELDATNRELAHRTEEMNRLAFFQRTIIRSLSAAVAVIGAGGQVTLWNLAAERLLGLAEHEAVGQVLWTLRIPALNRAVMARLRKSLQQGRTLRNEPVDYDLPTGGTGKAIVSVVPIVDGAAPLGAVFIFEDFTKAAALAAENQRLKDHAPRKRT